MPLEVPDVATGADPPLQYWATANLQRENEIERTPSSGRLSFPFSVLPASDPSP